MDDKTEYEIAKELNKSKKDTLHTNLINEDGWWLATILQNSTDKCERNCF